MAAVLRKTSHLHCPVWRSTISLIVPDGVVEGWGVAVTPVKASLIKSTSAEQHLLLTLTPPVSGNLTELHS